MRFIEMASKVPWGTLAKGALLLLAGGAATGTYMKSTAPIQTAPVKCEKAAPVTCNCTCPRPKFEITPYAVPK